MEASLKKGYQKYQFTSGVSLWRLWQKSLGKGREGGTWDEITTVEDVILIDGTPPK